MHHKFFNCIRIFCGCDGVVGWALLVGGLAGWLVWGWLASGGFAFGFSCFARFWIWWLVGCWLGGCVFVFCLGGGSSSSLPSDSDLKDCRLGAALECRNRDSSSLLSFGRSVSRGLFLRSAVAYVGGGTDSSITIERKKEQQARPAVAFCGIRLHG